MPQFDLYSYSCQVFWALIGFYTFYFFILNFYLVHFSEVLKMRQKLLASYSKKRRETNESVDILSSFLRAIFKKP